MTPRHKAARALAERDIPCFPCRVGGKIPICKDDGDRKWSETTDLAQIDPWWGKADYNIGVRPMHFGWLAVDLDTYKPTGVSEALLALLPDTYTHGTPHGGFQKFYVTAEEFGNQSIGVNVDIRSRNGYVLWPPSVVDGVEYRVVADCEPVPLPERIAAVLKAKQTPAEDAIEYSDDGEDKMPEEARAYCAKLAATGKDHSSRWQLAASLVRNFGLTNATATALCEEYGLRTYPGGESGTSWAATLAHARKYGKGELGAGVAFQYPESDGVIPPLWKALAARDPSLMPPGEVMGYEPCEHHDIESLDCDCVREPILAGSERGKAILDRLITDRGGVATEPAKEENTARRFRRRRPSEARDQPPMIWLDADNLFPSGPRIMVIYAEKENLKTQFALAKGIEIVARTGGHVLYIAAEDGHGIDTSRLPAYVEKRGVDWQNLDDHWWPISEPIDLLHDSAQLVADVNSDGFKPSVVVIDVMTACTGALDLNMPGNGNALMNAAQQIANGFSALVILLTHPGKDSDRGPVGSYAFTARADVVLLLKRQGDTLAVYIEKMKSGPSGKSLAFAVESHQGIPLIGALKSFERKRSLTDDDAVLTHLATAHANCFETGLNDRELAELIAGEQRPGEDGAAFATRVAKLADSLRQRHKSTRYGEKATMAGGNQLYWRWHYGPKVEARGVPPIE